MKRDPIQYTRLLVFVVLVPLLLADLFAGLPDGAFVVGAAAVTVTAAVIHFYGNDPASGAGWLVFAAAIALIGTVDPTANALYAVAFALFVVVGTGLLASRRLIGDRSE